MRRGAILFLLGVAALAFTLPARADPHPATAKRVQARRILAKIDLLDRQVEQNAEAYDLARIRLAQTRRNLRQNRFELLIARRNLLRARSLLSRRLVGLYEQDDSTSSIGVLLGATSLMDALDRLDAAERVAGADAALVRSVQTFARSVTRHRRVLRSELRRRSGLLAGLASKRRAIGARLAERQRLLASVQVEVARLQVVERARQERLRRQVEARLAAARAASVGEPGTVASAASQGPDPAPTAPAPGVTGTGPAAVPSAGHSEVVSIALRYLGVPYRWGGASPATGFDCSGFVMYVYAQVGISLPHNAALQFGYGVPVDASDLEPGDIVFFDNLGHDGIYIGGGQFIEAPKTGDVVKISRLSDSWYAATYVGARRLP